MIQRARISVISDLKEVSGKDPDDNRARTWITKVKSAIMRDQASDKKNAGPLPISKNWYLQLSRSTRNKWSDLLHSFLIHYCGLGVSVARSDEYPLDLYWLNAVAIIGCGLSGRSTSRAGSGQNPTEEGWSSHNLLCPESRCHIEGGKRDDHAGSGTSRSGIHQHIRQEHRSKIQGDDSNVTNARHPRNIQISDCGKRGHPADHCLFVCRGCGELHDMGKCRMEEFYNQVRQWFNPTKYTGMLPLRENVKLGRSSGWNPIRAERSSHCIYAFVHKPSVDQVSEQRHLPDNTRDLHGYHTFVISSLRQADEYARSDVTMAVDLHPGESRGYWKQHDPDLWFTLLQPRPRGLVGSQSIDDLDPRRHWISYMGDPVDIGSILLLWFRQAKIGGKTHNEKAILLLGTGTEVGCYIDSSQMQDCVEIGCNVYRTEGSTRIKMTLAGFLVYFFDIYLSDQEAILDMAFMFLAGIGLDLTHGSISLPDMELPFRLRTSDHEKFWITREDHWVPTVVNGARKIRYMRTCGSGSGWPAILSHDNSSQWGPGTIWSGRIWIWKGPWNPDLQIRKIRLCLRWSTPSMELRVEYCNGQGRRRSSV
ncbi:LOW QUALITY PROTEIN: hypothetical protein PHMEG_00012691 [Phytophthora megakarya]|uniref:Eukaryotic/viral aspartic protease n=1 Tax=Phytophthora megakarya TaxID=4795 RepID=A0A225WAQ0_9STRA|nr:LOW QUALITY PROTEIN: hypothetical protein PHMEG_00012691 [Phytophthora megakarya]